LTRMTVIECLTGRSWAGMLQQGLLPLRDASCK
jgi:hypothetical protein